MPLRILCFIDSLDTGGAQRQLCTLAVLFKKSGSEVSVLTYRNDNFFYPMLESEGIQCKAVRGNSKVNRVFEVRKILRNGNHDVVMAFLPSPCLYAEFAALPVRTWGLVVSERSAVPKSHYSRFPLKRMMHMVADYICTNSHTNRLMIEHSVPRLSGRVVTIYNAVDLETFKPLNYEKKDFGSKKIVVVASHQKNKNLLGLLKAMNIIKQKAHDIDVEIDWYGNIHADSRPYNEGVEFVKKFNLGNRIHFYPATKYLNEIYNSADAIALFSLYEGLPNVVCESMACGRPVLISNVSDSKNLVKNGVNGFLFNPTSSEEIADAIIKFCKLSQSEREIMGKKSREIAERLFNSEKVVSTYLNVLEAAACRKRISIQHWIPEIPKDARNVKIDA